MVDRVLVTGGSGFIGSELLRALVRENYRPCVLINSTSSGTPWRLAEYWSSICVHECNLLDSFALLEQFADHSPRLVFHLAAFTHAGRSWKRISECYLVNVVGTLHLLQAVTARRSPCLVYVSTSEVYGGECIIARETGEGRGFPMSPYAASKLAGEDIVRLFATRGDLSGAHTVRPFNVYGPRQAPDRVVPEAIVAALDGRDLAVTSAEQSRDFVFVDDVVDGLLSIGASSGEDESANAPIDFASGVNTSIRSVVNRVFELVGSKGSPRFGVLERRPNELMATPGSDAALKRLLGRELIDLGSGLNQTIDWYRGRQVNSAE